MTESITGAESPSKKNKRWKRYRKWLRRFLSQLVDALASGCLTGAKKAAAVVVYSALVGIAVMLLMGVCALFGIPISML